MTPRPSQKSVRELPVLAVLLLTVVATASAEKAKPEPIVLDELLSSDSAKVEVTLEKIAKSGDLTYAAPLIELLRAVGTGISSATSRAQLAKALDELTGEDLGDNWGAWVEWYASTPVRDPEGFIAWKGRLLARIDPRFSEIFRDGAPSRVRVGEIVWGGVAYEGIPALDSPTHIPAKDAAYLDDGDPVFGIAIGAEARAYPLRILDWHEMANDRVGDISFALAYCTLCGSGIAYDTTLPGGRARSFGSSGLLMRSNKLMVDRETKTLWNQFTGKPVLGSLAKAEELVLKKLPSVVTRWGEWKRRHPETLVLSPETGFERDYHLGAAYADYFASSRTMFPVLEAGGRIAPKARVFALEHEGDRQAWPVAELAHKGVSHGKVGNLEVVLIAEAPLLVTGRSIRSGSLRRYDAGAAVRAYESQGKRFTRKEPELLVDGAGQPWRMSEDALVGPDGERLRRVPGVLAYWFAWAAFNGPDDLSAP